MKPDSKPITTLMADDEPDDSLLVQEVFEENRLITNLEMVEDRAQLINFQHRRGKFARIEITSGLILLDLVMPRKSVLEELKEIKSDASLRHLPVVSLTTTKDEQGFIRS